MRLPKLTLFKPAEKSKEEPKDKYPLLLIKDDSGAGCYSGFYYSLMNEDNKLLNAWASCKDWTGDTIWQMINKKNGPLGNGKIHNFSSGQKLRNVKLLVNKVESTGKDTTKEIENSVRLMNDYFALAGKVKKVKILGYFISGKGKAFVLSIPRRIMSSPALFGLYLFMARWGVNYESNPLEYLKNCNLDSYNRQPCFIVLEHMVENGLSSLFPYTKKDFKLNWPDNLENNHNIHGYSGMVIYSEHFAKTKETYLQFINNYFLPQFGAKPKKIEAQLAKPN